MPELGNRWSHVYPNTAVAVTEVIGISAYSAGITDCFGSSVVSLVKLRTYSDQVWLQRSLSSGIRPTQYSIRKLSVQVVITVLHEAS